MIIGIDGASSDLSLALAEPDGALVEEVVWASAQRQSAELLPRLLDLMGRNECGWDQVSALAVGTGPGSFTGLRVAMALAKGLAVALARPFVGVPSLEAWLEAQPEAGAALARAGSREAYVLMRDAPAPVIADRDALPDGTVVAPAELAAAFGLSRAHQPRGAGVMTRRAAEQLTGDPSGDDVRTLEPIYLRAPRGVTTVSEGQVTWL